MEPAVLGFVILGVVSGFFSALLGAGAGVLIVPVLTIFGLFAVAGSASSVAVAMCSITAALHIRKRFTGPDALPWKPAAILAGSAFLTAHLGVSMAELAPLLAVPLVLSGLVFLNLDLYTRVERRLIGRTAIGAAPPDAFFGRYVLFGALTGTFGGILGSAGGLMLLPLLLAYCGVTTRQGVYYCLMMMLGSSLSAVSAQLYFGLPDLSIGIPLGIGAILGGYIGVIAIERVSEHTIRVLSRGFLTELALFLFFIWFFV